MFNILFAGLLCLLRQRTQLKREAREGDCLGSNEATLAHILPRGHGGLLLTSAVKLSNQISEVTKAERGACACARGCVSLKASRGRP